MLSEHLWVRGHHEFARIVEFIACQQELHEVPFFHNGPFCSNCLKWEILGVILKIHCLSRCCFLLRFTSAFRLRDGEFLISTPNSCSLQRHLQNQLMLVSTIANLSETPLLTRDCRYKARIREIKAACSRCCVWHQCLGAEHTRVAKAPKKCQ